MAAPTPTPSKVSLKLFVDKKAKKVLFAEAGNETVDFLCSILTLPVCTVIRLLSKLGCLSNLYQSIESLNDDYIEPNQHKDSVLNIIAPIPFGSNSFALPFLTYAPKKKKVYRCSSSSHNNCVSDKYGSPCPTTGCKYSMSYEVTLVEAAGNAASGGFVKGLVTYLVMDDLVVLPMSTSTLFNMFNITNMGAFEEKVVDLDMDKALKLLEISLQSSKNVLTTVFLN